MGKKQTRCIECGQVKRHHAHGLCPACYYAARRPYDQDPTVRANTSALNYWLHHNLPSHQHRHQNTRTGATA